MKGSFTKKLVAGSLMLALAGSMFTGCNKNANTHTTNDNQNNIESNGTVSYPIKTKEPVTLTMWGELNSNIGKFVANQGETDFAKELDKRTGVKIVYKHPPGGPDNRKQAFNIMVASRDLPDIILYNMNNEYPGGPEKAIDDQVIVPINKIGTQYAPDLIKFLDQQKTIKKYCVTNKGDLSMFPCVVNEKERINYGPMIRGDILEELNLPVPETIDEWYTTLKKIKETGKAQYPLSYSEKAPKIKWSGEFTAAYDIILGLWQKDQNNRIQFGAALPQYKEFLKEMNKWYKEGLLDPEFAVQDRDSLHAKVADGQAAAYIDAPSSMVNIITGWRSKDPNTKKVLVGAPQPVMKKGGKVSLGAKSLPINLNACAVITTSCKNPEVAAQFLNYGFTEEGAKLYSYGIEGKSYFVKDGKLVLADWLLKAPEKPTKETTDLNWVAGTGPFIRLDSLRTPEDYAVKEIYKAQKEIWTNVNDVNDLRVPELPPPLDKADKYAALYSQMDEYIDEMYVKFVMGVEPLDNFDQYVERLKKLGLDECTKIQQEMLDAWNKR